MMTIRLSLGLAMVSMAGALAAAPCPDEAPADGDVDRDGILNGSDLCCFISSPGILTDDVCASSDPTLDRNFNGISAGEEGQCCVWFSESIHCKNYGGDATCRANGGIPVPCDLLLWYLHMPLPGERGRGEGPEEVTCEGDDCICYTTGDLDGDDDPSAWGGDQPLDTEHPVDACPTVPGEAESNKDGDFWPDACDACPGTQQPHVVCDVAADSCRFPASCVPFTFRNPDRSLRIEYYCSGIGDADEDGRGDDCDNCPGEKNPDQADADSDNIGDVCDACPSGEPLSDTDPDDDSDGVTNSCDNCPKEGNADQADRDSDGAGDGCDNCPDHAAKDQGDLDSDGFGDACDMCPHRMDEEPTVGPDGDSDGVADSCDNCAGVVNTDQADLDSDGFGDACEMCPHDPHFALLTGPDEDHDGYADVCDLCPYRADERPVVGPDRDGDGIADECDNCDEVANPDQADENADGRGDACTPIDSYVGGGFSCSQSPPLRRIGEGRLFALLTLLTVN